MLWITALTLAHAACGDGTCPTPDDVDAALAAAPDGPAPPPPMDGLRPAEIRYATFALG